MADLNSIPGKGLNAFGGNSPKPTNGQANDSESDDEINDEARVEEGDNQGGRLESESLT